MKIIKPIKQAGKIVFLSKKYIALGIISFAAFLLLYLFTLPATYTGGRIGLISIKLLTVKLIIFSFIMASLIALIIPFTVYSFKKGGKIRKTSATGGFLGSVLPALLCCSPILPSLVALLGATSPALFGFSSSIQGFVATNETYILLGATFLLLFATVESAKSTKQCLC